MSSHSLDDLANSVASATFDVINEGQVRTPDMGGTLGFHIDSSDCLFCFRLCNYFRLHQCHYSKALK
jgi:hypothetical protein